MPMLVPASMPAAAGQFGYTPTTRSSQFDNTTLQKEGLLSQLANLAAQLQTRSGKQSLFGTVDTDEVLNNPLLAASYRQNPALASAAYERATGLPLADALKDKAFVAKDRLKFQLDLPQKLLFDPKHRYNEQTGTHQYLTGDPVMGESAWTDLGPEVQDTLNNPEIAMKALGKLPAHIQKRQIESKAKIAMLQNQVNTPGRAVQSPVTPPSEMSMANRARIFAANNSTLGRSMLETPLGVSEAGRNWLSNTMVGTANTLATPVNFVRGAMGATNDIGLNKVTRSDDLSLPSSNWENYIPPNPITALLDIYGANKR